MAKFKRSFQPGGFRPEQAGDGGEARMREYSKRIIQGLKEERDAIVSDRNRTADVLRENYQIESKQRDANAKIEQANIQRQIDEQRAISQRAVEEFKQKTDASKKVYDALGNLSQTASKKFAELEVQALEQKSQQEKAEILSLGYNHPLVKGIAALRRDMSIEEMEGSTQLGIAFSRGEISELEYTELMNKLNQLTPGGKSAVLNLLGKEFASFYTQKLNTDEGRQAAGNQQATLEFGQRVLAEWEQINGITGINAALKQDSGYYDKVFNTLQTASSKAGQIQTANNKTQWVDSKRFAIQNAATPERATEELEKMWPTMVAYLGTEGAHEQLKEWFSSFNAKDGKSVLNLNILKNANLGLSKDKQSYGEYWPNRIAAIETTLVDAQDAASRRKEQMRLTKNVAFYRKWQTENSDRLASMSPTETYNYLISFRDSLEKNPNFDPPPQLNSAIAQAESLMSREVQTDEALLNSLVNAPDQFTLERLGDFKTQIGRQKARQKYLEIKAKAKYGPNFEEVKKGINGDAREALKITGATSNTSQSLALQRAMLKRYQQWYNEGIRNGLSTKDAADYAQKNHDDNFKDRLKDTSIYYSTTDDKGRLVFPKLDQFELNSKRQQQEALQVIDENLTFFKNPKAVLASGAVISPQEMRDYSFAVSAGTTTEPYVTERLRHFQKRLNANRNGKQYTIGEIVDLAVKEHNRKNPYDQILAPREPVVERAIQYNAETDAQVARIAAEMERQDVLTSMPYVRPSMRGMVPTGGALNTNDPRIVSIGINEGTRTAGGGTTSAYQGHTDPGDQAANRGTFSYAPSRFGTDPNMTPEEADAAYMPNLTAAQSKYAPILLQFGYRPGTREYELAMFNILDLTVQAPAAVDDFVNIGLKNLVGSPLTKETLGDARAYAFYNRQGVLDAPGFDNNFERLRADQQRRSMTLLNY